MGLKGAAATAGEGIFRGVQLTAEWLLLLAATMALALVLPSASLTFGETHFLIAVGAVGVWRYTVRAIHFLRAMWFLHVRFPRLRKRADKLGADGVPSHVYFLATSFRIDAVSTGIVY